MTAANVFYVYVLFDWLGLPRYVGKGRGRRWLDHERTIDITNDAKNKFISETLMILGEIPKIKVRENIFEDEAFSTEVALIRAIGRLPRGPLTNLTDNRNGPSSERIKACHATRTPEERSASIRKIAIAMTSEALSNRGRKNALAHGSDVLAKRMKDIRASQPAAQRSAIAKLAGIASAAALTPEERRTRSAIARAAYMNNTTPAQRREIAKRSGLAKLTTEQLRANGRKGSAIALSNRTAEERRILAKKAVAALHASRTPEERSAMARRAANARKLKLMKLPFPTDAK